MPARKNPPRPAICPAPSACPWDCAAFPGGPVENLLRPVKELQQLLRERGVDPAQRVVVYGSAQSVKDWTEPARLFWILEYLGYPRVHVLDGGYDAWVREGRPVTKEPAVPAPPARSQAHPTQRIARQSPGDEPLGGCTGRDNAAHYRCPPRTLLSGNKERRLHQESRPHSRRHQCPHDLLPRARSRADEVRRSTAGAVSRFAFWSAEKHHYLL